MASLLARAQQIRKLIKTEEDLDSIPPEEREKILLEIESSVASNRLQIKENTFSFTSLKNDLKLPLLINLGAVLLLGGLGYYLYNYFGQAENYIINDRETVITLENKLIETLKKESAEQINAKDSEIREIQTRLEDMRIQQENLVREAENRIRQREDELRILYEEELEKERQRLISLGYSDAEIQRLMEDYITRKEMEFQSELTAAKQQIEEERIAREETLNSVISEYENTLLEARSEKEALEESFNQRYAEMERQLESEKDQALTRLEEISRKQEQEDFVLNNIFSFYSRIHQALNDQDLILAEEELAKLESYLAQDDILAMEAVQFRRELDLFMISSVKKLIQSEKQKSDADSILESAEILSEIGRAVEEGNRFYEEGDLEMARQSYLTAITSIPALDSGYANLKTIEQQELEQERINFLNTLEAGNQSFNSARYETAVDQYRQALEYLESDSDVVSQIINRLVDAGVAMETSKGKTLVSQAELSALNAAKLEQESRKSVIEGLTTLEGSITEPVEVETIPQVNTNSQAETLASQLNTKLLIMEVLASDSIKEEYPDLHEKMGDYLEAYGKEKEKAGREAALKEIVQLTDQLSRSLPGGISTPEEKEQKELFLQFLRNLKNILEM